MNRRRRILIAFMGAVLLFVLGSALDLPVLVIAALAWAIGWTFAPGIARAWDATTSDKDEE